jgi:hypothetical protein
MKVVPFADSAAITASNEVPAEKKEPAVVLEAEKKEWLSDEQKTKAPDVVEEVGKTTKDEPSQKETSAAPPAVVDALSAGVEKEAVEDNGPKKEEEVVQDAESTATFEPVVSQIKS